MSIVEATDLSHSFGDKKIFSHTSLSLFKGDKMGLTGLNGAGKSTLINILAGILIPDGGYVRWNPKVRMGYLDQQAKIGGEQSVRQYLKGAFEYLYRTDRRLQQINQQVAVCTDPAVLDPLLSEAGSCQNLLEINNFYALDSEIDKVAAGLGITAFGLDTPVGHLSGGQRAKVMLAKLLLENPDALLLDEPTNFLDRDHIEWLAKFLTAFKGSFILVSHDYKFLNRVANCICHIEFNAITRYNGSFESFVKQRELRAEEYVKNYNHQQKEIAKLEDYISRNLYRASTTAMAQSRRKKLEKMEKLDRPQQTPRPAFTFKYKSIPPKIMLRVKDLEVGYDQPLLPRLSLHLKTGEKLSVTGFNGIGKTTFLKTVAGLLPRLSGSYKFDENVVIGYYEQENRWEDPSRTALDEIKAHFPRLNDKEARGALARCGLRREQALQSLSTLSGGEQAKVKICRLTLTPCNLLMLDEPTNHLDQNAILQLKKAVSDFPGAAIFVSHSKDFCTELADKELNLEKLFD